MTLDINKDFDSKTAFSTLLQRCHFNEYFFVVVIYH